MPDIIITTNANNLEVVNTSCIRIVHRTLIQLMAVSIPVNRNKKMLHPNEYSEKKCKHFYDSITILSMKIC